MDAHEVPMVKCLLLTQKNRGPEMLPHQDVSLEHQNVEEASKALNEEQSTLKEAKRRLFAMYDDIMGEELLQEACRVEAAHREYEIC